MGTLDIDPADVIRLLEQYLKENNLLRTLQTLQDETSVSLNTVDSVETFVSDINNGHWDVVLKTVKLLDLPDAKLVDLYEQIAIELIELGEMRVANWLIHKTEPMKKLDSESPDRYLHLKNLMERTYFDYREAYRDGSTKKVRRSMIANALKKEVTVVPPQRLLSLLGDALKWQRHEGLLSSDTPIDLFTGKTKMTHVEEETFPNVLHKHCVRPLPSFNDEPPIFVLCAEFSPDGHYLIVGYSTGLIEVRNPTTGRLAFDLTYQTQPKDYIITPSKKAVLCIAFSAMGAMAVGDKSGDISVWDLKTGQLIQVFKSAHSKGTSCLVFHRSGKRILSGGQDQTIKLNGMLSNETVRDFRGHKSFIKALAFSKDDNYIVSGSSDCTVKIWNSKTAQILQEYRSQDKIHTVIALTHFKNDIFLIGDRSRCIQLIDLDAKVRTKLYHEPISDSKTMENKESCDVQSKNTLGDDLSQLAKFCGACASPKGNWVYALDSENIYCFNYSTKKVQKILRVNEEKDNELIGVRHHPFLNLLATYDYKGNLKLWKP